MLRRKFTEDPVSWPGLPSAGSTRLPVCASRLRCCVQHIPTTVAGLSKNGSRDPNHAVSLTIAATDWVRADFLRQALVRGMSVLPRLKPPPYVPRPPLPSSSRPASREPDWTSLESAGTSPSGGPDEEPFASNADRREKPVRAKPPPTGLHLSSRPSRRCDAANCNQWSDSTRQRASGFHVRARTSHRQEAPPRGRPRARPVLLHVPSGRRFSARGSSAT